MALNDSTYKEKPGPRQVTEGRTARAGAAYLRELPGSLAPALPDALAEGQAGERPREHAAADRAKQVLIVNPAGLAERGGMGRMLRYLVGVWAEWTDAPAARVLDSRGLGSVYWSPFYVARAAFDIVRLRLSGRARLLHINMAENASVARKGLLVGVGKLIGLPVLLHLHAGAFITFYENLPAPLRPAVRWLFRAADHVVVLGELWKTYLIDRLKVDADRISVIYSGVANAPLKARHRAAGPCRLIYVGRVRMEKGLAELISALAQPQLKGRSWTLTVVGAGETRALQEMIADCGLSSRVRFTGWLEPAAVQTELAGADVFVLPSHYEGMPLSILEALASGLAVIATAVGALPEVLDHDQTALLVPPRDERALAQAIIRLVDEPDLRSRLGAAGLALHADRFHLDAFARRIVALYDRLAPLKP